ncbi:MAG TPA: retroviral-like aspartic protease family protein [Terriglobales bacterium]|nr:retroviral-like aspartic protease family protein [Terriglobales bacterium]
MASEFMLAGGGADLTESTRKIVPLEQSTVPFRLYNGYTIIAQGTIGGLTSQNLLIDTGASPTIIDQRAADKLGLKRELAKLALFNRNVPAQNAVVKNVVFGPVHRDILPVLVADLSSIERQLKLRVDAIIGLDLIGERSFSIDYKHKLISFGAAQDSQEVPFSSGPPFITVAIKIANRPMRLLVDTGTFGLMLFGSQVRGLDAEMTKVNGSSHNIGGRFRYQTMVVPAAKLGRVNFGQQYVSVVDDQLDWGRQFDGLMGIPFLHPSRISFNFERNTFGWSH